jgi:hypothetical protein
MMKDVGTTTRFYHLLPLDGREAHKFQFSNSCIDVVKEWGNKHLKHPFQVVRSISTIIWSNEK